MAQVKKEVLLSLFERENIPDLGKLVERFEEHGFNVTIGPSYRRATSAELREALRGKFAYVSGGEILTREVFAGCDSLKIVARMGAGADNIDVAAAAEYGIAAAVSPGTNAPAVAEHAVTMMLTLARKVAFLDKKVRQGVWAPAFGTGLYGKTLGIIGLGAIGKLLAQYVSGFRMKVIAYDLYHDEAFARQHGVSYCSLEPLLRESDFISLHCPITEGNRHMLSSKEFEIMKKDARIINCARGPLIDEGALYRALTEGKIAGAALDVWEQEPVSRDNPLLAMDNVVITSHVAGLTYEVSGRLIERAFQQIIEFSQGKIPEGMLPGGVPPGPDIPSGG